MVDLSNADHQIQLVTSFQELVSTPYKKQINAMCWQRELIGDFSEIVNKIQLTDNIVEVSEELLRDLELSEYGQLAREIILSDMRALNAHGGSPVLNVIECYERDDLYSFFATDVYSFHVDRSPIPTDTYLCTYHGESSEIVPNSQATQKILIPEIREELKKIYRGPDNGFETFLEENFFDLHYQAHSNAKTTRLGLGHIWKLAVDHPESKVPPCLHRAPEEKDGENRLLLIC